VLAAVAVNLLGVCPLFLTGAMAVQISRDFGVSPASIGVLASVFAVASMVGSAPLGGRVRVWGVRRSLRLSSTLAICALLMATVSPSVPILGLALLIAGTGNALGQPAGNSLVASQIPQSRFGLGFGIKQSAIPLATMLGGLAVPMVALTIGWRAAYLMAAVAALGAMALVPPDRMVSTNRSESSVPRREQRPLWLLSLGLAAAAFAAVSIGALGAAGGVEVGLSEAAAGFLVAAGGFFGLAIRLGAGALADKRYFDSLAAVSGLCLLGALGWMAMAAGSVMLFAIGLIVANAFGWGWPGLAHLSVARRFPSATGAASGIAQSGVSTGVLLGPLLLGIAAVTVGWQWTWLAAATAAIVGAIVVRFAARRIPDPTAPTAAVNPSVSP
ncbi:MAG: MFS transporter, partial [Actinomycetes bacterium]